MKGSDLMNQTITWRRLLAMLLALACILSLTSGIAATQPTQEQTQTTEGATPEETASEETVTEEEPSDGGKPATRAVSTSTSNAKGLYFDFEGTDIDKERYKASKYGYLATDTTKKTKVNYDENTTKRWVSGKDITINSVGSDVLKYTTSGTSAVWFRTTSTGSNTYDHFTLNYTLGANDYFITRFRIDNPNLADGATGTLTNVNANLHDNVYGSSASDSQYWNSIKKNNVSYKDDRYMTVAISYKEHAKSTINCVQLSLNGLPTGSIVYIDYIYVGPVSDDIYFGFENDDAAKVHYAREFAYGYKNFDVADGWRPVNGTLARSATETGAMKLTHDGSKTTFSLGTDYNDTTDPAEDMLNYVPKNAKYAQIRLQFQFGSGEQNNIPEGAYLKLRYVPGTNGEKDIAGATYKLTDFQRKSRSYMIITLPLTDPNFLNENIISRFDIYFGEFGNVSGDVYVDYLYIGTSDNMYFGFEDSKPMSEKMSSSYVYGYTDYDDCAKWRGIVATAADGSNTLKLTGNTSSYFSLSTYDRLHYLPVDAQYLEVRLRLKDFGALVGDPYMRLSQYSNSIRTEVQDDATRHYFSEEEWNSGEFFTVTMPLDKLLFRDVGIINEIKLLFHNFPTGTNGYVEIDYFYIGDERSLPSTLYFDFTDTEYDHARYYTNTYGYETKRDKVETWEGHGALYPVNDGTLANGTGTLVGTQKGTTNDGQMSPVTKAGLMTLNYTPGENDWCAVRLKLENAENSGTNGVYIQLGAYGANTHGEKDANKKIAGDIYPGKDLVESGQYFTVVFPLNREEYKALGRVYAIMVAAGSGLGYVKAKDSGKPVTYTIDWVYVGDEEHLPVDTIHVDEQNKAKVSPYLFYDFTDSYRAQERYEAKTYAGNGTTQLFGTNYDRMENWYATDYVTLNSMAATSTTGTSMTGSYTPFVQGNGTMRYWFPMYPYNFQTRHTTLQYTIPKEETVWCAVRFKLGNAKGREIWARNVYDKSYFSLVFSYDGVKTDSIDTPYRQTAAFRVSEAMEDYVILQFEIPRSNTNFYKATELTGLSFLIDQIEPLNDGPITFDVDYLYLGPQEGLPLNDTKEGARVNLLFDFSNTLEDRERYKNVAYGFENFDSQMTFWGTNGWVADSRVGNHKGELVLTYHPGKTEGSPSTSSIETSLLNGFDRERDPLLHYYTANIEFFQIRFKLEGVALKDQTSLPYARCEVFPAENLAEEYGKKASVGTNYAFAEANGDYYVLTSAVQDDIRKMPDISCIRAFFGNLNPPEGSKLIIDYIYLGTEDGLPHQRNLYFEFTNDEHAQERYDSYTYGFLQFDRWDSTNGGYWSTHFNDSATSAHKEFSIDPSGIGTLTLDVTYEAGENWEAAYGYGPFLKVTDTWGKDINTNSGKDYMPLHYLPKEADVLQVRFKPTDCVPAEAGSSPRMVLEYYYRNGTTISKGETILNFTITNDEYIILTVDLDETFRSAEEILGFGLRFQRIRTKDADTTGKIEIDYIFLGDEECLPMPEELWFQFTNTIHDRLHYHGKTYMYHQFDQYSSMAGGRWASFRSDTEKAFSIDTSGVGNLTIDVLNQNADEEGTYGPWLHPTDVYGHHASNEAGAQQYLPLYYKPTKGDYLQVRFKLDGCVAQNEEEQLQLAFEYYYEDPSGYEKTTEFIDYEFAAADGEYLILTYRISETFRSKDIIEGIGLRFCGVKSEGEIGAVVVDYIYIGPEDRLPSQRYLYFHFDNKKADQERYDTDTYGHINFDDPDNIYWETYHVKVDMTNNVPEIKPEDSAMVLHAVTNLPDAQYPDIYMDTSYPGNGTEKDPERRYPLNFQPQYAEYYQIRFKMEGFREGTQYATVKHPFVHLQYYVGKDANGNEQYARASTIDFPIPVEALTNGEYIVATLPMTEQFRAEEAITRIRAYFGGVESIDGQQGKLTIDYIYVGPYEQLPDEDKKLVIFVDEKGNTVQSGYVKYGGEAIYEGTEPKDYEENNNLFIYYGWSSNRSNEIFQTNTYPMVTQDTTYTMMYHRLR